MQPLTVFVREMQSSTKRVNPLEKYREAGKKQIVLFFYPTKHSYYHPEDWLTRLHACVCLFSVHRSSNSKGKTEKGGKKDIFIHVLGVVLVIVIETVEGGSPELSAPIRKHRHSLTFCNLIFLHSTSTFLPACLSAWPIDFGNDEWSLSAAALHSAHSAHQ